MKIVVRLMSPSSINDVAYFRSFRNVPREIVRLGVYVIGYYDVCAETRFRKKGTDEAVYEIRNYEIKIKQKNGSTKSKKKIVFFSSQKIL